MKKNIKKEDTKLVNCSFTGSGVVDTFNEEVNLSLKDKIKLTKSPIDVQFKKKINNFIEELNSLTEDELIENLDVIKNTYINDIIRPTLIELINNVEDKNLYTSLKLELYSLTLEDLSDLQLLINSLGPIANNDRLINGFANKLLDYVRFKLAFKRSSLLSDVRF